MQSLDALTRQAAALGQGEVNPGPNHAPLGAAEAEVDRVLQICNACRYCEGFCAVFPAMARRIEFPTADIHYLANLCHHCGACWHACQYAPPHEFAVNLPRAMAQVRGKTYADYAWPSALGALYARSGLTVALALAAGLALFMLLAVGLNGSLGTPAGASGAGAAGSIRGNFYAVFPHGLMVALFAPIFCFACLALGLGLRRFWREISPGAASAAALGEASGAALTLKYLGGGQGQGCNEADDRFTLWRRHFHHATAGGFMLCFAATSVATLYHYAWGWPAPYAVNSLPVLLGIAGGIGLLIGPAGLLYLNLVRPPELSDPAQRALDRGLIVLLLLTSATGLALLAWRDSRAMALLLAVHLGCVMALFLTLPYGKFAHGLFRAAALLKWSIEKRQPTKLQLGSD